MNPFGGGLKRIHAFVSQNQLEYFIFFRSKASFRLIKKKSQAFYTWDDFAEREGLHNIKFKSFLKGFFKFFQFKTASFNP
jgi:hypothetical protein